MKMEMIFSGFGGQGALTIGKFIAQAAMIEGKNVSWLPSYGPEMRGGTANVSTVVSDTPIASPLVSFPNLLVVLNQPSLDKFGPDVVEGGLVIVNSDMCPNVQKRDNIEYVVAPLNTYAIEIGSAMVLNMITIGIIIKKTGIIKYETIESYLKNYMKNKNPELLAMNIKAIKKGMDL
ncbi:MAG: 2-oxoacid:acceptor oxidoreductase family protein [Candidatus Cloacimonetes bacterium]|jgi:2-oxoglutarate ferredoxin oxidoreductase subunit gamma|nr:2-oxoacid:acceptor oxidoreductase family protein [Candidatus Cloacimonadota bacterium]